MTAKLERLKQTNHERLEALELAPSAEMGVLYLQMRLDALTNHILGDEGSQIRDRFEVEYEEKYVPPFLDELEEEKTRQAAMTLAI